MTDEVRWVGLGEPMLVTGDRQINAQRRFNERYNHAVAAHEHLWIATAGFLVTPPFQDGTMLDTENIIGPPSLGCYVCEREYSDKLAARRCTGEP